MHNGLPCDRNETRFKAGTLLPEMGNLVPGYCESPLIESNMIGALNLADPLSFIYLSFSLTLA